MKAIWLARRTLPLFLFSFVLPFACLVPVTADTPKKAEESEASETAKEAVPVCIWKVTGKQTHHYLMGSVHLLTENEYPLPAIYDDVYAEARRIVFEVPMEDLTSLQSIAKVMQTAMYQGDKTLKSELTEATYNRLMTLLKSSNDFFALRLVAEKLRPGFLVMGISEIKMQKVGASANHGLEMVFHNRAKKDEKPSSGLETVEFQVSLLSDLTKEQEEALVVAMLDDLDSIGEMFHQTVNLWKAGDADRLAQFMNREMEVMPELAETLLYERNRNWIPQLEEIFAGETTALIIVGAGHLAGKESVVDLLQKRGYTVEQLTRPPADWGKPPQPPEDRFPAPAEAEDAGTAKRPDSAKKIGAPD